MGEELDRDRIVALDKKRVWRPYTEMSRYREQIDPLVIVRAHGSRLYDADGRTYLDANASWWTSVLGHSQSASGGGAAEAVRRALPHGPGGDRSRSRGGARRADLRGSRPEVSSTSSTSDNGSTAVEVAMKLALQYWEQNGGRERKCFVSLADAFHGETLGRYGPRRVWRSSDVPSRAPCSTVFTPPAFAGRLFRSREIPHGSGRSHVLRGRASGPRWWSSRWCRVWRVCRSMTRSFCGGVRALCDAHDVLLVCDEVFTGYGRTGPMWACEHADVAPDLLCTAKGFSGGMFPMAATLATERNLRGLPRRW